MCVRGIVPGMHGLGHVLWVCGIGPAPPDQGHTAQTRNMVSGRRAGTVIAPRVWASMGIRCNSTLPMLQRIPIQPSHIPGSEMMENIG